MKVLQCVLGLGAAVLVAGLCETVGAQSRKAFEVASIRPLDQPYTRPPSSRVTPGRFEMTGANAKDVVARAFGIEWQQKPRIIAPDWADREPFEIRALMPNGATERDLPEMLKTLLEERFHFKAHVEQRPFPVYELVVLPSGSKLREVAAADELQKPFVSPVGPAIFDVVTGLPGDELRTIQAPAGPDSAAALYYVRSRTSYALRVLSGGVRQIDAARITMPEFSQAMRPSVDRPVVDKTGLKGIYELKTVLPPPRLSPAMQALLGDRIDTAPSGVSVSRSLEELGLKLNPKDSPVDFIVIDHIERPSPD